MSGMDTGYKSADQLMSSLGRLVADGVLTSDVIERMDKALNVCVLGPFALYINKDAEAVLLFQMFRDDRVVLAISLSDDGPHPDADGSRAATVTPSVIFTRQLTDTEIADITRGLPKLREYDTAAVIGILDEIILAISARMPWPAAVN